MPLAKSLPACKKNGQFTTHIGQPPSSLATPPAPRPSPHRSPSRSASLSSRLASSSRADLADLIDPSSDSDHALIFAASSHSHSMSPTIPAPNRSRSPLPTTSNFPTSLDSNQPDSSQTNASAVRYIIPAGFDTTLQFLPALVSCPRLPQSHSVPAPITNLPPHPVTGHNRLPTSRLPLPSHIMSNYTSCLPLLSQAASEAASRGPAAMPLARTSKALRFSGKDDELLSEFL